MKKISYVILTLVFILSVSYLAKSSCAAGSEDSGIWYYSVGSDTYNTSYDRWLNTHRFGAAVSVPNGGSITKIGIKIQADSGHSDLKLALYDSSTSYPLGSCTFAAPVGTGWVDCTLPTPYFITNSNTVTVFAMNSITGGVTPYCSGSLGTKYWQDGLNYANFPSIYGSVDTSIGANAMRVYVEGQCGGQPTQNSADTWTAYDVSLACVNDVIANYAKPNDTVNVPAGSATWDSSLTINKGITLQGAGAGNTVIKSNVGAESFMLIYSPNYPALNEAFRVTGFTWDMNSNSNGFQLNNTGSGNISPLTKIRIDHNTFSNHIATGGHHIDTFEINGPVYGVVDNNTFLGPFTHLDNYGRNTADDWTYLIYTFGDGEKLYYEDNIMTGDDAFETTGHGGRSVFRYNSFIYTGTAGLFPWFDAHGNQGAGIYSTMGIEVYGNCLIAPNITYANSIRFFHHRGGMARFFYNFASMNNGNYGELSVEEEFTDSTSPPGNDAISGEPQHVSNSYYWNNRLNSTIMHAVIIGDSSNGCGGTPNDPPVIVENREFWQMVDSPAFDGTTGVGCGTLASRPATCTTGVGYWATNQSCSTVDAANVGANPKTPISGTLYKCTAPNTWSTIGDGVTYTPYTYPHPLRNEGVLYGDVDGSHDVTAYDAALVAQAAVGLITFTADKIKVGDVDGNGSIAAYDAALIAQKAVGLISKFPVE